MGRGIRGLAVLLSQPAGWSSPAPAKLSPWGPRRASGRRAQRRAHSCPPSPLQLLCQRWELPGLPGAGAAQAPGLPMPGFFLCRDTLEGSGWHEQTPLKMVIC